MTEEKDDDFTADDVELISGDEDEGAVSAPAADAVSKAELDAERDKFMRLYAEFDNYRKRVNKDREELFKYQNEALMAELLTSVDNMEIALAHMADAPEACKGLTEGVEATRRELMRTLEKFGLQAIEAEGKPFDPQFHHAISQAEHEDVPEGTVVAVFRKGYIYKDKTLRATMVAVSKRPEQAEG